MEFSEKLSAAVAAEKKRLDLPTNGWGGFSRDYTPEEFASLLYSLDVYSKLYKSSAPSVPAAVPGFWEGVRNFFRPSPPRKGAAVVPTASGISIPEVGEIPPFEKASVSWEDTLEGADIVAKATYISFYTLTGGLVEVPKEVGQFLLGRMPRYEIDLPEEVGWLPIPPWVEDRRRDIATDVGGGMTEVICFRSELERMAREFVKNLPADLHCPTCANAGGEHCSSVEKPKSKRYEIVSGYLKGTTYKSQLEMLEAFRQIDGRSFISGMEIFNGDPNVIPEGCLNTLGKFRVVR